MSELVTNARKYAPGPCLLDLEISEGAVQISVWDSTTTLPSIQTPVPDFMRVTTAQRGAPAFAAKRTKPSPPTPPGTRRPGTARKPSPGEASSP
ncbi:hypothetical protein ACWCQ0_26590 [Streptomyces massasporeus]|uniref:hypothetical protein n=1 Tax=Streptomyces massasporeus TaxID=67324 RepID=UPI003F5414C7